MRAIGLFPAMWVSLAVVIRILVTLNPRYLWPVPKQGKRAARYSVVCRSVGDERFDNNFLVANKYRSFIMGSPEIEMRVIKARP